MSFFKKIFDLIFAPAESNKSDLKSNDAIASSKVTGLNQEHQKIVELYTRKNPTSFTSKEILETIAEELGEKPGRVRSILSKAGVYVKQEKLSWKNNKELWSEKVKSVPPWWYRRHHEDLSDELKEDEEIALMSVASDPFSYTKFPEKLKLNKEFLMKSIDIVKENDAQYIGYLFDPEVLKFFREDKEVLLKGWNSLNPKDSTSLMMFQHPWEEGQAFDDDHNALTRDRELMLTIVRDNPQYFLSVPSQFKEDFAFLDIVGADNFSDYLDRVLPRLRGDDLDEDYDDDEVIEIP